MKKILFILTILFATIKLYSQSIGDFTLIHLISGKTYNYYDDPNIFFDIVGDDTVIQFEDKFKDYKGEEFKCSIFHKKIEVESWEPAYLLNAFGIIDCTNYYCFSDLVVYKNFKTSRDISIGDNYQKILNNYKDEIYYSSIPFDDIDALIDIKKISSESEKQIKPNSCLFIKNAFFKYNRYPEINHPLTYYLVFELDKKRNVKSIRFTYIYDAV